MSVRIVLTNGIIELEGVNLKEFEESLENGKDTFEVFIPKERGWDRHTVFKSHLVMYTRYDSRSGLVDDVYKPNVR